MNGDFPNQDIGTSPFQPPMASYPLAKSKLEFQDFELSPWKDGNYGSVHHD
ncbi:MAG: hypothetical protein LVT47_03300 [Cyanobacteria bacterium LVE1205-1]